MIALLSTTRFYEVKAVAPPQDRSKGEVVYFPMVSFNEYSQSPGDKLGELIKNHPNQVRPAMYENAILTRVAQAKAMDMAERSYFSHTNPEGIGPNYLVQQAGYSLPDWYCQDIGCNNIESLAGGFAAPEDVLNGLLTSPAHRQHLLGEHPFFAEQLDYGIGYADVPGSMYGYYWVIITARH